MAAGALGGIKAPLKLQSRCAAEAEKKAAGGAVPPMPSEAALRAFREVHYIVPLAEFEERVGRDLVGTPEERRAAVGLFFL